MFTGLEKFKFNNVLKIRFLRILQANYLSNTLLVIRKKDLPKCKMDRFTFVSMILEMDSDMFILRIKNMVNKPILQWI